MAIYPAYPNSEIYILKNIPITNEDKVNFYGKSAEFQAGYFLGAEYKTPDKFLRNKEKLDSIDISAMLKYYPNCVYVGLKYSVIKSNYIEIPINIYNLQSGNYLVFRNNIKPYVTDVEPDSDSVDVSHSENIFNDMYRSGETKPPILDWASTDFIYAFITNLEYINANATRVYFAVDKFTTYCRDIQYKECLIEREHDDKDKGFYYDYIYEDFKYDTDTKSYPIVSYNTGDYSFIFVLLSSKDLSYRIEYIDREQNNPFKNDSPNGTLNFNGIATGQYAYCFDNVNTLQKFMNNVSLLGLSEQINTVFLIPKNEIQGQIIIDNINTNVSLRSSRRYDNLLIYYLVNSSSTSIEFEDREKYNATGTILYKMQSSFVTFDLPKKDIFTNGQIISNQDVKNNKSLSYINIKLVGDDNTDIPIHILTSNTLKFNYTCVDFIPSAQSFCYLEKGDGSNLLANKMKFCAQLSHPTTSANYDKALNNYSLLTSKISNLRSKETWQGLMNTAIFLASLANPISAAITSGNLVGGLVSSETQISNLLSGAATENNGNIGSLQSNAKQSSGTLGFYLNITYPTHSDLTIIDDYFSAYGYKTNRFGKPRFITGAKGNRKLYNYIKTTNCNYILNRPFEDINEIRQLFNNGVRMWTPYNYTDFAEGRICFGDKVTVNTNNPNA